MTRDLVVMRAQSIRSYELNEGGYGDFRGDVQVTEVDLGGVRAYVREGHRASSRDTFVMSSNARLRHKSEQHLVGRQVLYLAAPARAWDAIAAAVGKIDALGRPVERHQRWTMKTAPEVMTLGRPVTRTKETTMHVQKADSVAPMSTKKVGRKPRGGKLAAGQFTMRVTERERKAWAKVADAAGVSVSTWLRTLANTAAGVDVPPGAEAKEPT